MVSSVATILAIRGYLYLTGYPELGNKDLHIAHMLWGGLLMMATIIILLVFLSKTAQKLAAIIGGIGFGTFIDEVGKFITQDHDYFFKPSVAIIYAIFILIFLIVRAILNRKHYSQDEYLMNAIQDLEEIAFHDLDVEERGRILDYLDKSDPTNPLISKLREVIEWADLVPTPNPGIFRRITERVNEGYRRVSAIRGFGLIIIALLMFEMVSSFSYVLHVALSGDKQWIEWCQMLSSLASALLLFWGAFKLRKSRLSAFRLFEQSILVSIFFTQVFIFYREEFGALIGLGVDILMLMAIRFMIEREKGKLAGSRFVKELNPPQPPLNPS